MQGSFPLEPRPFAAVASAAEVSEPEVLTRVQRLLDERIIRQVTPIYDTRALGYGSMLVAAKVDPENPWQAAKIVNSHPGVSHNYLRNHDFNMWFTLAVEPDSRLGLDGTLDVLKKLTGAESIRQLPTLKLFKIRMDLEMEGGTKALTSEGVAVEPVDLEPVPYDELDKDVIRATQGDMPVISEPYAPAAERLGMDTEALLEHMQGMRERGLLRRVAAILYHRRAGFSANGMGVWKVSPEQIAELGPRMASFRGISHCYERPTYEDWPYSVFTMAHGRSKEECDAVLDAIAEQTGIHERATLYSSTEFKKIRLLYFTEDFKNWESEHAWSTSLADARSAELYRRALEVLPGGVNSPVRAMRAIGRSPIFVDRGEGAELIDVDGNRFVDYVCSWGPLIHGHAHPGGARRGGCGGGEGHELRRAYRRRGRAGGGGRTPVRRRRDAAHDLLGDRGDDDRRPARARGHRARAAAQVRRGLPRAPRPLLAQAGSGLATQALPSSPGVPAEYRCRHDRRALERPRGAARRRGADRLVDTSSRRSSPSRSPPTWASSHPAPASSSFYASSPTPAGRC